MKIEFEEKHVRWGLAVFIVVTACILVFFAIYRFDALSELIGVITAILTPFIYGVVFAYLLCPVYNFATRHVYHLLSQKAGRPRFALSLAKGVASFLSMLVFFVVITGVCWMIIPGLIESIMHIAGILPESMERFIDWINIKLVSLPLLHDMLESWITRFTDNITNYVEQRMIPEYTEIVTSISTGVFGVLNVLKNFFIGVIICVYFLNSKEHFAAQSKKLILAVCREKKANDIFKGAAFTNKTFGGFINGKIIDSLIIGLICFVTMSIFHWEYPLLISCIVGITNIIPFFGPFIGAIPSALLILMINPMQCLYFLIFILILQQVDGNIIGPKILGDSTGLPSFWVMFAILVGGGLFGFAGMIIGIPLFAVFYAYFRTAVNNKLEKKGFSTDIRDYTIDRYRIQSDRKGKKTKGGAGK